MVAFPTETFYGLGVDPFNEKAVHRLYQLKQRSPSQPILVIIDRLSQLQALISNFPRPYENLVNKYWPGPLTLVFPARAELPGVLTGESGTIGVRMSSGIEAAAICAAVAMPITGTSANISGAPPASSAEEVLNYFSEGVDLVIDGGSSEATESSTIVSVDDAGRILILRKGIVVLEEK